MFSFEKLFLKYSYNHTPRWVVLFLDLMLCAFSYVFITFIILNLRKVNIDVWELVASKSIRLIFKILLINRLSSVATVSHISLLSNMGGAKTVYHFFAFHLSSTLVFLTTTQSYLFNYFTNSAAFSELYLQSEGNLPDLT